MVDGGALHADAAAGPAAARGADPLIDPVALQDALDSAAPPVVLDVRWSLAGTDDAAFRAGHVPHAVFVDLDKDLAAPPGAGGRHPLPDPAVVDALFRRAGIRPGTSVVVCGQRDTSVAARAWWVLRWAGHDDIRVLDGGFEAWQRAGLPVATGAGTDPGGGTEVTRPGHLPVVDADGAASYGASTGEVLVDVRAPERYRGDVEPVDPVPGHIPGAVNLPLAAIHRPDGRLADPAELRRAFASVGVQAGVAAAASCGSGVNACSLVLAGQVAGLDVSLYPGSYSGWCALGREVIRG